MSKATRVLVDQARVGDPEWLSMFRRLTADLDAHREDLRNPARELAAGGLDPREPLVWAHCVLRSMPSTRRQDYAALKEHSSDGRGIEDGLESMRAARYGYVETRVPAHRLLWLARLVRTLDDDLSQLYFLSEGDVPRTWTTDAWRPADYPCYVVPVDRSHRLVDGKPAERRSMRYHAIVPDRIGEYEVRLALLHDQVPARPRTTPPKPIYGAALFPGLQVGIKHVGQGFVATDVECERQRETMLEQVAAARAAECDILMWPELTVADGTATWLAEQLALDGIRGERKVRIVAPGSWHRPLKNAWVNRMSLLDGRGETLFEYDKRMKFSLKSKKGQDGRPEEIQPGKILQVLVTGDRLVTVGICRDFCDDIEGAIYEVLDVDLVLVPSMGDVKTMEAHSRHARGPRSRHETSLFVVQQVPVLHGHSHPVEEPQGYSFVDPSAAKSVPVTQNEIFRALEGRPTLDDKRAEH